MDIHTDMRQTSEGETRFPTKLMEADVEYIPFAMPTSASKAPFMVRLQDAYMTHSPETIFHQRAGMLFLKDPFFDSF